MSTDSQAAPRRLPDRPNLRHLKDQAKDLLKTGAATSITDAQFKIARLYGFASWPKLKAHVESFEEVGRLKQAIDTNDIVLVKALMTRNRRCTLLRWVTERMGHSRGLPNAAFHGNRRVL